MTKQSETWLDFWQQENEFDQSMAVNYAYFLDRVEKYIPLSPGMRVLDIGSGPGNLEDAWYGRVAEIDGLDVSTRYNDIARARHKAHPNVRFHDLPADDYFNFSAVAGKKFDVIIVMSVVQYYRDAAEAEQLLRAIQSVAAPGAKALVCDLMVEGGAIKDALSMLGRSLKQGKLFATLSLLVRLRLSKYYSVRKENGFLVVPEKEWLQMCRKLGLNARFVDESLTMQQERRNLLIQF